MLRPRVVLNACTPKHCTRCYTQNHGFVIWITRCVVSDPLPRDSHQSIPRPTDSGLTPSKLLRYVQDAVIATDPALRITSWNPAAEALYDWSATEVFGCSARETLQTPRSRHVCAPPSPPTRSLSTTHTLRLRSSVPGVRGLTRRELPPAFEENRQLLNDTLTALGYTASSSPRMALRQPRGGRASPGTHPDGHPDAAAGRVGGHAPAASGGHGNDSHHRAHCTGDGA
jgi:hypothetical protein